MKFTKTACVLYEKSSKRFDNGDGELEDDIFDAYIFRNEEEAGFYLTNCDFPEDFEIWDIEISYQTK